MLVDPDSPLAASSIPPIDCLPEDVLITTFSYIMDPITLSHVCRSWRNLDLSIATLWSHIKVDTCRWRMDTFLLRSHPTRLVIDAYFGNDAKCSRKVLENLKVALEHLPRIEVVRATSQSHFSCWELMSVLRKALHRLQHSFLKTLELNFDSPTMFDSSFVSHQSTSSLRNLHFVNIGIPFDSPILRNLTSLYIDSWDGYRRSLPPITLPQILNVLRKCPNLTKLHLGHTVIDDVNETITSSGTPSADSVALPLLAEVSLRYVDLEISISLVDAIKTSKHTNWRVSTKFPILEDSDSLVSLIQAINEQIDVSGETNLSISFSNDDMKIGISRLIDKKGSLEHLNGGQIKMRFKWPGTYRSARLALPDTITETVSLFSGVLEYDSVRSLQVGFFNSGRRHGIVHRGYQCLDWDRLLRNLPLLRYISLDLSFLSEEMTKSYPDPLQELKEEIMDGITNALTPTTSSNNLPSQFIACPGLQALDIMLGFGHARKELLSCMRLRNNCGSRLRVLRVKWAEEEDIYHEFLAEATNSVDNVYLEVA